MRPFERLGWFYRLAHSWSQHYEIDVLLSRPTQPNWFEVNNIGSSAASLRLNSHAHSRWNFHFAHLMCRKNIVRNVANIKKTLNIKLCLISARNVCQQIRSIERSPEECFKKTYSCLLFISAEINPGVLNTLLLSKTIANAWDPTSNHISLSFDYLWSGHLCFHLINNPIYEPKSSYKNNNKHSHPTFRIKFFGEGSFEIRCHIFIFEFVRFVVDSAGPAQVLWSPLIRHQEISTRILITLEK